MRAGDIAHNPATEEWRIVVEYSKVHNQVTFAGDHKWYDARPWRTNMRPK